MRWLLLVATAFLLAACASQPTDNGATTGVDPAFVAKPLLAEVRQLLSASESAALSQRALADGHATLLKQYRPASELANLQRVMNSYGVITNFPLTNGESARFANHVTSALGQANRLTLVPPESADCGVLMLFSVSDQGNGQTLVETVTLVFDWPKALKIGGNDPFKVFLKTGLWAAISRETLASHELATSTAATALLESHYQRMLASAVNQLLAPATD